MPRSPVEIAIEARDNASAVLDSVRHNLQLLDQFGRPASNLAETFNTGAAKLDPQHV